MYSLLLKVVEVARNKYLYLLILGKLYIMEEEQCGTNMNGNKKFPCSECGKCFTYNSKHVIHMRSHTGERPFVCPHCEKRFTQSGSLKNHMKIHTDEKPYKCNECGKCFSQNSHLQTHLKIHTGEKSFRMWKILYRSGSSEKTHDNSYR